MCMVGASKQRNTKAHSGIRGTSGFTMLETITVVAIVAILLGVAFVGIWQVRISMHQLEMDATAKELFIAAQNHLSSVADQGLFESRAEDKKGSQLDSEKSKGIYYIVYDGTTATSNPNDRASALGLMLPFGSIDDTVRTGGSYVIRYQPEEGRVLDVFYSNRDGFGSHTFSSSEYAAGTLSNGQKGLLDIMGASHSSDRQRYKGSSGAEGIIGYFGGEQAQALGSVSLKPPTVKITNGNKLKVEISGLADNVQRINAFNEGKAEADKASLRVVLYVEGATSESLMWFDSNQTAEQEGEVLPLSGNLSSGYSCVLDDISRGSGHFSDWVIYADKKNQFQFGKNNDPFTLGEDLKIHAEVTATNALSNIGSSSTGVVNSLFETCTENTTTAPLGFNVTVANIRHLENLDGDVSGFNVKDPFVKSAFNAKKQSNLLLGQSATSDYLYDSVNVTQVSDMSWDDFLQECGTNAQVFTRSKTGISTSSTAHGEFLPVNTGYTLTYSAKRGSNDAHSISKVHVDNTKTNGSGNAFVVKGEDSAGLFGTLSSRSSISDLELIDFSVKTGTGAAGALAGTNDGTITVKDNEGNETVTNNGSVAITNVLVRNSPSASDSDLQITSTGGSAGGLIGALADSGSSVTGCAAAVYVSAGASAGGLIGAAPDGGSVTNSYSGGHTRGGQYQTALGDDSSTPAVNEAIGRVNVTSTGGNAGGLVGTSNANITYCYSTCSTNSASGTSAAGGLVGSATGGMISNCYATGLVLGSASSKGAFVGSNSAELSNNRYFQIINGDLGPIAGETNSNVTALDADTSAYNTYVPITSDAVPYDSTLTTYYGGKYALRTVAGLCELAHLTDNTVDVPTTPSWLTTHYGDWPAPETFVINTRS